MNHNPQPQRSLPSLENLPTFSDENIGDVVELLYALVDACEQHYAAPLNRWRKLRYLEMCDSHQNDQYDLPLDDLDSEIY